MNAVSQARPADAPNEASASGQRVPGLATAARLGLIPLLWILTAFWVYVTLSNVIYAYAMSVSLAAMGALHVYATWDARVIQHVLLYPVMIGCVLASMRVGWQPAWRTWPLQAVMGILFSALASPALIVAEKLTSDPELSDSSATHDMAHFWAGPEPSLWLSSTTSFLLTYGFALALVSGFTLYRRFRDSQLRVAALERAWSAAHLSALRMQLSPHTLFNLLHTIRGEIVWDPRAAQAMIVQLGDLLRRLLTAGERDFSRLSDELQFVRLYLELQKKRFADRMTIDLPHIDALPLVWVPSLILQPLVENAVVHGLAGHEGPVNVRVEVEIQGERLLMRVTNTIAPNHLPGLSGVGVRNVRERLAVQFRDKATFTVGPSGTGEWIASIGMPLLRDVAPARLTPASELPQ
ncbi:MAG TPA: histidine kinase [Steroidobacteraceae bacterium]|jgi:hypothetical protein|nr:histidine kinase [Steroidobacteraceae bacterium]